MRNCVRTFASLDYCNCLEASSVKAMIGSCSCYGIKCSKVCLTSSVLCVRGRGITCCVYAFCRPVLSPGKSCIDIFITVNIRECKIIICTGSYNNIGSVCYFDSGKIKCSVFFNDYLCASSGSLISLISYCYSSDCLDVSCQLLFCRAFCRYKFTVFSIVSCRYSYLFCIERSLDRCIFAIFIADNQSMGTCCQCSGCDLAICICNFCSVNSIFCCKTFRKSAIQSDCCFCICCMNVCNCCFYACFCQNLFIINIKCDDSLVSVISNAVNGFAHHGFIMFR